MGIYDDFYWGLKKIYGHKGEIAIVKTDRHFIGRSHNITGWETKAGLISCYGGVDNVKKLKTNSYITYNELRDFINGEEFNGKSVINWMGLVNCKKLLKKIDLRDKDKVDSEFIIEDDYIMLDELYNLLENNTYLKVNNVLSLFFNKK